MSHRKDDWDKPRATWQHLTEEEIARIRAAYKARIPPWDIARELKCSTRVVQKYYSQFLNTGVPRQPEPTPASPTEKPRHYKGNFEL